MALDEFEMRAAARASEGVTMKTISPLLMTGAMLAPLFTGVMFAGSASAQTPPEVQKLNAYVGCINRLSERSYSSRERYFSWAAKTGPTGKSYGQKLVTG